MNRDKLRQSQKQRRHYHVRNKVHGTADRPRLTVFRSLKNISVQVINDDEGVTLASASTLAKDLKGELKTGGSVKAAEAVGSAIAKVAIAAGIIGHDGVLQGCWAIYATALGDT